MIRTNIDGFMRRAAMAHWRAAGAPWSVRDMRIDVYHARYGVSVLHLPTGCMAASDDPADGGVDAVVTALYRAMMGGTD